MAGKKKGKKEKAPKEAMEGGTDAVNEAKTLEYYQVKVADLTEKLERMKAKGDSLVKENTTLAKAQAKSYSDKQDIVEFLNIKVGEHEKMIVTLEERNRVLEQEKKEQELFYKQEYHHLQKLSQDEIENLNHQCFKYNTELNELSAFTKQKEEIEEQLKQLRFQLERKEQDYKDTIHNLERKVLQDKSQMKREMLQKVNEAVANFRKVADQQMAETTKRAIRENMTITSQLKKMSTKTMELIQENEELTEKVSKLKKFNQLLTESEKELAKKNNSSQKVVKMLVEKLKESDQMLELAFDDPLKQLDQQETEPQREYLTDEMIQEMRSLQDDYNLLIDRITEVNQLGRNMSLVLTEAKNVIGKKDNVFILEYIQNNLPALVSKLKDLTNVENDSETINNVDELDNDDGLKESQFPDLEGQSQTELLVMETDNLENNDSNSSGSIHSAANGWRKPKKLHALTVIPNKPGTFTTKYQRKVEENFYKMIAPKSNFSKKYFYQSEDMDGKREVGVQTTDIKFGPKTNTDFLLGEVRPWGAKAEYLPQKGLYFSRATPSKKGNANNAVFSPLDLTVTSRWDGPKSIDTPLTIGEKVQGKPLRL